MFELIEEISDVIDFEEIVLDCYHGLPDGNGVAGTGGDKCTIVSRTMDAISSCEGGHRWEVQSEEHWPRVQAILQYRRFSFSKSP